MLTLPLLLGVAGMAKRRAVESGSEQVAQERAMRGDAKRREFETRLSRALEMADDEVGAFDVVGRAMRSLAPDDPVELLLADNSHAHLERVVVSAPDDAAPGLPRRLARPVRGRHAARRPRCSPTARRSTRARCFAAARRVGAPACASPSRSWDARSA